MPYSIVFIIVIFVSVICISNTEHVRLSINVPEHITDFLEQSDPPTDWGDGVAPDNNQGKAQPGGKPTYVLPLAAPLNKPELTYVPPWSFGFEKWDLRAGAAGVFGPSGNFRSSYIRGGDTQPWPPGIPPEMNPNLYIQPPPYGVLPTPLEVHEDLIVDKMKYPKRPGPQGEVNGHPVFPRTIRQEELPPDIANQIPYQGENFGPLPNLPPPTSGNGMFPGFGGGGGGGGEGGFIELASKIQPLPINSKYLNNGKIFLHSSQLSTITRCYKCYFLL